MKKFTKATAALMLMMVFAMSCTKPDEPNNGGNNNDQNDSIVDHSGTLNGHDYVDLGLPSGTLWATCNVGAVMPYEYGHCFAWGETERKKDYDWDTYNWCNGVQLIKYCNKSNYGYEGFTDDLTILQSGDDAATVNWGSGWHTPTKEQWQELIDNTASEWTTQNDVNGRVFYGNGQSLFLPAAGGSWGIGLHEDGIFGFYWSRSLLTDYPHYAWILYFSTLRCHTDYNIRCYGFSVRPVREN